MRRFLLITGLSVLGGLGLMLAGAFSTSNKSAGSPSIFSNGKLDLPPFRMVRQVSTEEGSATFEFVWENEKTWKDTLVESTTPHADIGRYQEARNGKVINYVLQHVKETPAQAGIQVPGPWFTDLDWVLTRATQTQSSGNGTYALSEDDTTNVLSVTNKAGTERWVFDKGTGIPLDYQQIVDGNIVVEHKATSVVLLNGQVVR